MLKKHIWIHFFYFIMLNRNSSRMAEGKSVTQPPWLMAIKETRIKIFIIDLAHCRVLTDCFSVSISSLWCGRPVSVSCFPFKHKITRSNTPFKHPLRSNTPTLHQEIPSLGEKTSVKLIKANVTELCRRLTTLIGKLYC